MMAQLASLPADLLLAIFVPDSTRLAICVAHTSLLTMIDLHVWQRRMQMVASDVRRLRFRASSDGTTLTVAKTHAIVRHHLRLPRSY